MTIGLTVTIHICCLRRELIPVPRCKHDKLRNYGQRQSGRPILSYREADNQILSHAKLYPDVNLRSSGSYYTTPKSQAALLPYAMHQCHWAERQEKSKLKLPPTTHDGDNPIKWLGLTAQYNNSARFEMAPSFWWCYVDRALIISI